MNTRSTKKIMRYAFMRLMRNNILILVSYCICGLMDNIIVGGHLGKDALAAIGFFSPVTVIAGISYVIILGTQVLTGNLIGKGQTKTVNRLFMSSFYLLTVFFSLFSVICLVFNSGLASILGASGEAGDLLKEYIKGYVPGIVFQTLSGMLMSLCPFNNKIKLSYISVAAMTAVNFAGDILLVDHMGILGIALASSLSSVAAFLVLLSGFIKKDQLFRISFKESFSFALISDAAVRGIPSLMLTFGVVIKNYCFNNALNSSAGAGGVAVAGIMATVSALVSAVPAGCCNAYSTLCSICFGEEDRESLLDLTRVTLITGIISSAAVTLLVMAFSPALSVLFLPNDQSVQPIAHMMFIIGFTYLVPNVMYNIFLQAYRSQNRMLLVNIMSFAETALIGLFVLITVRIFGTNAAWSANTIIDILCVIIVMISVIVYKGGFDLSLEAMLKLPDGFGANEDEYMTFSVNDKQDVSKASENVSTFCLEHGYSNKSSSLISLCVEEIVANIIEHGFRDIGLYYCDIRVVIKDNMLTIRTRDNCREYDPRKRIEAFDPENPDKNIGMRIVSKIAKDLDYYNNAGINTFIMKFHGAKLHDIKE